MSICLILSSWLALLYKNGRREIGGEFMSSLSSSVCPCFLRTSLSGVHVDKLFASSSFYLAWSDLWESGRSWRTRHASQLSRNVHLSQCFFRVVESKGSLMGMVPRNPLSPSPVPCSHKDSKDPILHQHQSWLELWFWKTLESPLDCKEIKPAFLKETNHKYSLQGLMLKLQYFDHLMGRADSLEKTLMLGKKEMEVAEDEMVRKHHWLNRHESEQTLGDSERQGSLVCFSSWGGKKSNTT